MTSRPPLAPRAALRWSVVRRLLDDIQPRRVLELGCGQGGFGARIAERAEYVGCEPDAESCAVARQRIEPLGGTVLHGTSELVGEDAAFDMVCAFEVIEHLEDDVGALTDWVTRLAPGGTVIVSVPAWPERFGPMDEVAGHYRRYTPEQLEAVLVKAGCVDPRHVLYGWPLSYVTETTWNWIARRRGVGDRDSMSERSAGSGRMFQPGPRTGTLVRVGVAPFAVMQRMRPTSGTGLIGLARRAG
jgi:SAM-dependent methyltransferase